MRISEAKDRYPIGEVATRLGLAPVRERDRIVCHCPFHSDSHPSMVLRETGKYAGRYICRPCGSADHAEGDVVDLVQRVKKFAHPMEAVQWLEGREHDEPFRPVARGPQFEPPVINEDLSAFAFQAKVERTDAAFEYLQRRGLARVIDEFHIGSTDARGFPESLLPLYWDSQSGRVTHHRNFRNRLIIPYLDGGRVPYVNARAMGDQKPKYLKAQTPHKSAHTPPYLLDHVLAQGVDNIFLCEGELDTLSLYAAHDDLHACGIPGVGSLMDHHLESFEGRAVWIVMDNDPAGKQARVDLERRLLPYARIVHQVHLPPEHNDLNAFLVARGRRFVGGYFEAVIRKAVRRSVRRTF